MKSQRQLTNPTKFSSKIFYISAANFSPKTEKSRQTPVRGEPGGLSGAENVVKTPENRDDSNGKSLRTAGFKAPLFGDTATKNWPTVKSANQYGGELGTRTPDPLRVMQVL